MFSIYLFCLIVGGVLILVSILGHSDHDTGGDLDSAGGILDAGHADLDGGGLDHGGLDQEGLGEIGHADVDHGEIGHDAGGDEGAIDASHHPALSDITRFFSLRNLTFATAFFGLTGVVGEKMVAAAGYIVLPTSVSVGLIAWIVTHRTFQLLKNEQPTSGLVPRDFVGTLAEVVVPLTSEKPGIVRVTLKGKQVQLRARARPDCTDPAGAPATFGPAERVVIVELQGGIAVIEPV